MCSSDLLSLLIEIKSNAVHSTSYSATNDSHVNILELNWWVLGDALWRVFSVKISTSKTVSYLKKAIKDEKKNVFNVTDADSLNLWKGE